MPYSLPLEQMTKDEKLEALDRIWADLQKDSDEEELPEWQVQELRAREAAAANGENPLLTLDELDERMKRAMGWK